MCALETGKSVGPIPAPVSGEIIAINEAVTSNPTLVNSDPYGQGWIAKLRPSDLEGEKADLATGQAAIEVFQQLMTDRNISCQ
jgi:glycine cleavage system H protein